MNPSGPVSRFAITRYRIRLAVARLNFARPQALDTVNLLLAVVGAWSVIFAVLHWLPSVIIHVPIWALAVLLILIWLRLIWIRLARRPQELFRLASVSEDRIDHLRQLLAIGMRNEAAYDSLFRLYQPLLAEIGASQSGPDIPIDAAGKPCLVLTWIPQPEMQLEDVLIGTAQPRDRAWEERTSEFAAERQMFIASLRRNLFHQNRFGDDKGTNLVLEELDPEKVCMSFSTARYGQIVRTSDSLINEFAAFGFFSERSALRGRAKPLTFASADLLKVMPWRAAVHSWDGKDVLTRPRSRASGIGVSLALVQREGASASVVLGRRSSRVGTYPDVLHVIPAGMMNVHDTGAGDHSMKFMPRLTMLAEFLEECFNVEVLEGHVTGNFAAMVNHELEERGLNDLNPRFTGIALDLLNLRTEICGVLDLSSHSRIMDDFRVSWEYTHNEQLRIVDLNEGATALDRTDFVQSGIGCIHLAKRWNHHVNGTIADKRP